MDAAQLAEFCQSTVGQRVTAFALGVRDPKQVGRIARGEAHPDPEQGLRLAAFADAVRKLADAYRSAGGVTTCLFGMCPELDDEAMIMRIHHGDLDGFEIGVRHYVRAMHGDGGYY